MALRHITSASQLEKPIINKIFSTADSLKAKKRSWKILEGFVMATLFYEPSTRTRLSFESSMLHLGGSVISTENAKDFSSAAKGETIEDTVRVVNSYCDVIVMRHYTAGASDLAAKYAIVPVVNAGDGNGEHPTQALLDLYTIFSKVKKSTFTISMIGDLLNGRTVHSLSILLSLYPNSKIIFVSPKKLAVPQNLINHLKKTKTKYIETEDFNSAVKESDVIYQTRIQKERFNTESEYQKYFGKYIIDSSTLKISKKNAVIMHPLPRINEITADVDNDPRAIYFEQVKNGLLVRMALLCYIFDKFPQKHA